MGFGSINDGVHPWNNKQHKLLYKNDRSCLFIYFFKCCSELNIHFLCII